ncbi:MAG: DUF4340 domain-containing protein [Vicinamibacterales bacterium]
MKRARSTLLLLLVAAGLGAYIYFVENKRPPASETENKKAKVFTVEPDKIQELQVTSSKGEKTTLKKDNGAWKIVEPMASDADSTEVTSIATTLASLENQRTVEENPADTAPFGLSPAAMEVAFKAEGMSDFKRLFLGKKNPTGSDLYAKTSDGSRVFLVSSYLDTTFDHGTFDLRDKSVLKFERNNVTAMDIEVQGQPAVQLAKSNTDWKMKGPWESRGDYGPIEGLLGRIASGQMKTLVTETATDLKTYGLDKPAVKVTIGAGSAQASLAIGGGAEGDTFYAKDGSRGLVFTVDKSFVDELKKTPDTYRPKDLFEFRTFSGDRVEVVRSGVKTVFERLKGQGENAAETWQQTDPKLDVPEAKITDFLSKISTIRADSFVDAVPAGAKEIATINTRFGTEKKEEKATFYQHDADIFATRPEDRGAMKLTGTTFGEAMAAMDQMKPEPKTDEPKADATKPDEKKPDEKK